ncbi:MAG: T9SS type A sorting domain-containing protein [Ignavibacteria bacterium]|nr:T9SS type A sorting domain-containing protein [Ignavibacteria bacterium]
MKRVTIIVIGILALLVQIYESRAQETLPRLGVRKWTITPPNMRGTGSVAYARNADLFFVGTKHGFVLVVDTKQGRIIDTINMRDYPSVWDKIKGLSQQRVVNIGTTYDGSLVAFRSGDIANVGTVMIEYPSKRLLDSAERGLGFYDHYPPQGLVLSPKGRFLAMDYGVVIDRLTGKTWKTTQRAQFERMSFDEAESKLAYRSDSTINGVTYFGFVLVQSLSDTGIAPIRTGLYGYPTLSTDGSKIMTSGGAASVSVPERLLEYRVVVMDLITRDIQWELRGNGEPAFGYFAWSPDVKTYFGIRSSSWLPDDERNRLYKWNVGETKPHAIVDETRIASDKLPTFNNEMTEFFVASQSEIFAVDLTQTPTNIAHESASSKPDLIYPNPASGSVTVSCSSTSQAVTWSIYTNSGANVAQGTLDVNTDNENNTYNIQLPPGLAPSVYILVLQNADGVKTCAYRVMTL